MYAGLWFLGYTSLIGAACCRSGRGPTGARAKKGGRRRGGGGRRSRQGGPGGIRKQRPITSFFSVNPVLDIIVDAPTVKKAAAASAPPATVLDLIVDAPTVKKAAAAAKEVEAAAVEAATDEMTVETAEEVETAVEAAAVEGVGMLFPPSDVTAAAMELADPANQVQETGVSLDELLATEDKTGIAVPSLFDDAEMAGLLGDLDALGPPEPAPGFGAAPELPSAAGLLTTVGTEMTAAGMEMTEAGIESVAMAVATASMPPVPAPVPALPVPVPVVPEAGDTRVDLFLESLGDLTQYDIDTVPIPADCTKAERAEIAIEITEAKNRKHAKESAERKRNANRMLCAEMNTWIQIAMASPVVPPELKVRIATAEQVVKNQPIVRPRKYRQPSTLERRRAKRAQMAAKLERRRATSH